MNEAGVHSGMVFYHPGLVPLLVGIDEVTQHPDNPNNGDTDAIAESIETNGMYRPIYAQRSTGHIVAGNHTWAVCKELSADAIPVVWLDLDDATAKRVMLADNRVASLAQPDDALLLALLEGIAETDSLLGTGYAEHDLEVLRKLAEIPVGYEPVASWPTITVRVPPHVRAAYYAMTAAAVGDRERFELMMRLAGWDGHA